MQARSEPCWPARQAQVNSFMALLLKIFNRVWAECYPKLYCLTLHGRLGKGSKICTDPGNGILPVRLGGKLIYPPHQLTSTEQILTFLPKDKTCAHGFFVNCIFVSMVCILHHLCAHGLCSAHFLCITSLCLWFVYCIFVSVICVLDICAHCCIFYLCVCDFHVTSSLYPLFIYSIFAYS